MQKSSAILLLFSVQMFFILELTIGSFGRFLEIYSLNLSTRANLILTGKKKIGIWIIIAQVLQRSSDSSYNMFCSCLDSTRYGVTKEKVYDNNREATSLWLGKCVCWNKLFQLTNTKYVTTMKSYCPVEYN